MSLKQVCVVRTVPRHATLPLAVRSWGLRQSPSPRTILTLILLQEIETWVMALARYDNNEFDEALGDFESIADTSKILFNMGVIHATLGEHEKAVRTAVANL